jgi:hypothetical protein
MSERGCRARGWERSLLSKNSEVQQMKTERKEDSLKGLKSRRGDDENGRRRGD